MAPLTTFLLYGALFLLAPPIASAGVWEGFSDDVVGRVDVTNEYDGAELNTEYIFGVFGYQGSINTTRLVPVARDTKIIALTLTESIVSWSLIAEYDYGVDGMPYQPIQIDAWLKYDPSNPTKMTAYDFTFRRYAWSVQEAFPYLLKPIANELGYSVEEGDNGDRTERRANLVQQQPDQDESGRGYVRSVRTPQPVQIAWLNVQ
ncbi:hypothetical protein BT69DRAFT_1300048 [Atractiella rhizophila]|nr:hypothetical protein BT69DRAFT_1300048 [Atractiella rhizophila]